MTHDDFETEPVPGLPAHLPEGEHIVWQGKPDRRAFARSILHERLIIGYFAILIAWKFFTGLYDGESIAASAYTGATLALGGFVVLLMIRWYARAVERTTIYTITNKRVVMRFGIALPITFNFPFSQIVDANMKKVIDEKGTITLGLKEHTKISWLVLWPHARPFKIAQPQPSMRLVPDVEGVAKLLGEKLQEFHAEQNGSVVLASKRKLHLNTAEAKGRVPADAMLQEQRA